MLAIEERSSGPLEDYYNLLYVTLATKLDETVVRANRV